MRSFFPTYMNSRGRKEAQNKTNLAKNISSGVLGHTRHPKLRLQLSSNTPKNILQVRVNPVCEASIVEQLM
ncbi:MAG: hypothetical protein WCP55_08715 [Lentisphaerota bacterium]